MVHILWYVHMCHCLIQGTEVRRHEGVNWKAKESEGKRRKATERRSDEGSVAIATTTEEAANSLVVDIWRINQDTNARDKTGPAPEPQPSVAPSLRRSSPLRASHSANLSLSWPGFLSHQT